MQSPNSIFIIFILFIFFTFPKSRSEDDEQFQECHSQTFRCGQALHSIGYPFWGNNRPQFCGHPDFELTCHGDDFATIGSEGGEFRIIEINQTSLAITLARLDLWDTYCPPNPIRNQTLDLNSLVRITPLVRYLNIYYGCVSTNSTFGSRHNFTCDDDDRWRGRFGVYADESFSRVGVGSYVSCEVGMEVPVMRRSLDGLWNGSVTLQEALNHGFEMAYYAETESCLRCNNSGGICGSDPGTRAFMCLCRDQPYDSTCPNHGGKLNLRLKIGIGFASAGFTIALMSVVFCIYLRKHKKYYIPSSLGSREISSHPHSMNDLEKDGSYMGVHLFSYGELEDATNNFDPKQELGDGGFGTVYRGKLKDGRVVAVKRLYENNYKRVEQFMNEVDLLTRLRHQNLVTLYGCTSRHCRELLLVYEFIPNGTLADHLHGDLAKPGSLTWTQRMNIAIETASALAYLHASDVIHRDVKSTNILLDKNFSVKVADFGLSRLFPNHVTHVSTAPQGTPGYVDPEYHECYQLTDRSDVYSFGVVLAELISSKPAVDISRHRHEINLSNMAMNKIQSRLLHELIDPCLGFDSDPKVRKMITKVAELAFQCLQGAKDMRPSMEEALKALRDIHGGDYDGKKEKDDKAAGGDDDAVLLKGETFNLSPDSVTTNWISNVTTPSASQ